MLNDDFNYVVDHQLKICTDVLVDKNGEYSSASDRLHNFKQAAHMQKITQKQAVGGMMSKHVTSVFDMIRSEEDFSIEVWNEKITDTINYLLLLKAVVVEETWADQAKFEKED